MLFLFFPTSITWNNSTRMRLIILNQIMEKRLFPLCIKMTTQVGSFKQGLKRQRDEASWETKRLFHFNTCFQMRRAIKKRGNEWEVPYIYFTPKLLLISRMLLLFNLECWRRLVSQFGRIPQISQSTSGKLGARTNWLSSTGFSLLFSDQHLRRILSLQLAVCARLARRFHFFGAFIRPRTRPNATQKRQFHSNHGDNTREAEIFPLVLSVALIYSLVKTLNSPPRPCDRCAFHPANL